MADKTTNNGRNMSKEDILKQIVSILDAFNEPVDFAAIDKALGSLHKERTLRRWLSELVESGQIHKTGIKRGRRYQLVRSGKSANEVSDIEASKGDSPSSSDTRVRKALDFVRQPIYTRPPVTYNDDWLDSYQPNKTFYLCAKDREVLASLGASNMTGERAGTYARKIYNRLLIDLSYNSSRLEGNTYSLVDTEKLIIEGVGHNGKLDEERVMILNHKEAIRYLVDNAARLEITPTEIFTLHYLLSDGLVASKNAGRIREEGVRIGSSTYHPMENPALLKKTLNKICDKASVIKDPFEQSIFLLAHIACLQAFIDVNKRVSRLSANIPLIKHNFIPLSFNDVDKLYYADAMIAIYELNDISALADIYRFSYRRSCEHHKITAQVLGFDEVRVRYRAVRREIVRGIINENLQGIDMRGYIVENTTGAVPVKEQKAFIKTVYDDLDTISLSTVRGMGIAQAELAHWLETKNTMDKK